MEKSISSPTYSLFLDWLKQRRADQGLTIRELAELLGEHPSVIGKIETGQRRLDIFEYVQYCRLLKVKPAEGLAVLQGGSDL